VQVSMLLEGRRLIERGSRWLLRHRPRPIAIAPAVERFAAGAEALYDSIPRLIGAPGDEPLLRRAAELEQAGVPAKLAGRVSGLGIMFSTLDVVEVSNESGLEIEQVAGVHFRVGSVLQLHWLLGHILALSRDDRWQALARAALRDDLYSLHRALTAEVLRSESAGDVDAWVAANPDAERCLQTLGDIRAGNAFDLTTLPVAVREVRNLLQAAS
jgi:glutamate dehydrogenase